MRIAPFIVGGVAVLGAALLISLPSYDRPPLVAEEYGPSALEQVNLINPRTPIAYNTVPEPLPVAAAGGPLAKDVYKNVQVLGDVPKPEFDRLMVAITQWVSPKQGCGFCHNLNADSSGQVNYADDALYTDKVARQMLKMTMHVNTDWGNHVAPSGVTCYSCHRGENIPARVWYKQPEPEHSGIMGKPRNWQTNAPNIRNFFPTTANEEWLVADNDAHMESQAALPGERGSGVAAEATTEDMYIMMMLWSDGIGANCGLCHNSRALYDWKQSTPYRLDGLWGQYLTQDINKNYLIPVATLLPREQLGQMGDSAKADCGTCHMGQQKPLGGYNMISHYMALAPNGISAGPDQAMRDTMRPIEIVGPAYDPTAKVVPVAIPAYPPPAETAANEPAGGGTPAGAGAPVGPAVVTPSEPATGMTPPTTEAPTSQTAPATGAAP